MFASKTPRDLNHDPLPHAWYSPNGFFSGRSGGPYRAAVGDSPGWRSEHAPRPEFDHVQHNEPNWMLVGLRIDAAAIGIEQAAREHLMELDDVFDNSTEEDFGIEAAKHARLVIDRILNIFYPADLQDTP